MAILARSTVTAWRLLPLPPVTCMVAGSSGQFVEVVTVGRRGDLFVCGLSKHLPELCRRHQEVFPEPQNRKVAAIGVSIRRSPPNAENGAGFLNRDGGTISPIVSVCCGGVAVVIHGVYTTSHDPDFHDVLRMTDVFIDVRQWAPMPTAVLTLSDDEWAGYEFVLILEGVEIAHFEIRRSENALPLNARRFQSVPLGLLERTFRNAVNETNDSFKELNGTSLFTEEEWPSKDDKPRADDLLLAGLAQRYVETLGEPQQMACLGEWSREDPSRGHWTNGTVSQKITLARQRNLLTKTTKGRRGGQLTPKALSLLGLLPISAWKQATPDVKLAALRREARRKRIEKELLGQYRSGLVDAETYSARSVALSAVLYGTIDGDAAAIEYLKATYKELDI